MRYYSPLRYPGGKSKLNKQIINLFEINNYEKGIYIEPFAGGAGVALFLLMNSYVDRIHINDLDLSIYSFWKTIVDDSESLIKLIYETPIDIDEWKKQKKIQEKPEEASILELAFSTFYLNRTNISGIIKGGAIGGYGQEGKYKIDARFNKKGLVERIEKIAQHRDKIKVTNLCVTDLIENEIKKIEDRCFIYFDPPYYVKGPELYRNHLTHDDHLKIANMIQEIEEHYWIVSYDNVKEIETMYDMFRKKTYSLNYSAGKATKGKEIMIFSNNLELKFKAGEIQIIL